MSGAATYGPDLGANDAEYGAYLTNGGARPVTYAQLGQSSTGLAPGMVPPQMPMTGVGMNPAFAQAVGGSSEGMQQQQQQLQGLPGAIPGMPQHMAGVHPYAMQGMAMAQQYSAAGVPMQYYQVAHAAAPSFAQMVPNYQFGTAPQFMHAGEWEDEYDESNGTVLYGNLEVKHRRRTTPEQLRVLEHWFEINPRPDNAMREWLASELGITKRNVQVWFQNRRAKIKQQEKAREAAAAEKKEQQAEGATATTTTDGKPASQTDSTPGNNADAPRPSPSAPPGGASTTPATQAGSVQSTPAAATLSSSVPSPARASVGSKPQTPTTNLLPSARLDMGRRVSIAGGDEASIEEWAIKRRQQLGHTPPTAMLSPGSNVPLGMAAAARRNSQPYPTQIITHHVGGTEDAAAAAAALSRSALGSPKISPNAANGRTPGHLLFTAMRNNTIRRASMPGGGAQLISSTAFTPPRVTSAYHTNASDATSARLGARELSPIKDQDQEIDPALRQVPMTFITPPQNGANGNLFGVPGSNDQGLQYSLNPGLPFTPNSPLPNPSFSFGGTPAPPDALTIANMYGSADKIGSSGLLENDPNHALFMALERGRLASIASVNSVATNGTEATAAEYGSDSEWGSIMPPGFDPDIRRASAPADLLHNIGLLGISGGASAANPNFIRPSPLAVNPLQPGAQGQQQGQQQGYDLRVPMSAPLQPSSSSSSATLGGGPYLPAPSSHSPTQTSSAVPSEGPSPSGTHLQINAQNIAGMMPPPMLPAQQQYQQQQQQQQQHQYAESSAVLPGSFPNVPDPSAYAAGLMSASASSTGGSGPELGGPPTAPSAAAAELDFGFDFVAGNADDKDQFAFLSDLTNDSGSDMVNVLV